MNRRGFLIGMAAASTAAVSVANARGRSENGYQIHEIRISASAFVPAVFDAAPGDIMRWTNYDLVPRTATVIGGSWDTGHLGRGGTSGIILRPGMQQEYYFRYHPSMKGRISLRVIEG